MPDVIPPPAGQPPTIVAPVQTITPDVTTSVPPGGPTISQAAPPPPSAPAAPAPPGPVTVGEEGDIPADAELIQLSKGALKSRLARATRSELKERFGTDNPDEIKAKLDKLATFEAQQEEQRLASLSELEREREARVKAESTAKEWEDQYTALRETHTVRREHTRVEGIAAKHVDPTMVRFGLSEFQGYLQTKTDAEINALTDQDIDQWFAAKVREMPKLGREPAAPPPVVVETIPLTSGPPAAGSAPPPGPQQERSLSPSAANPMTAHEARAAAAKMGYRY